MRLSFPSFNTFLHVLGIERIDPPAANIGSFDTRDLEIYNKLVNDLKKACERYCVRPADVRAVNHYVVFKEVASWELLENRLRAIYVQEETNRLKTRQGQLQPTNIQAWVAIWSTFIINLREIELTARVAHNAAIKKTGDQSLENKYLEELRKLLDEGKQQLKDDVDKDYLVKDERCAPLLLFLIENWSSLEVFSQPDWRTTAWNSSGLFFQIFSDSDDDEIAEMSRHSATRAIFTITEEAIVDAAAVSSSPTKDSRNYVQASKIQVQMHPVAASVTTPVTVPVSSIKKSSSQAEVVTSVQHYINADSLKVNNDIKANSSKANNIYSYITKQNMEASRNLSQQLNKIVDAAARAVNIHLAKGESVHQPFPQEQTFLSRFISTTPVSRPIIAINSSISAGESKANSPPRR